MVSEASLRRAGLQLFADPATHCYNKPTVEADGKITVPAFSPDCIQAILGVSTREYKIGSRDNRADQIAFGNWIDTARTPAGERLLYILNNVGWGHAFNSIIGKQVKDLPAGGASHTPIKEDPIADIQSSIKSIDDILKFIADPLNWAAIIGLVASVPLILYSAIQIMKVNPTNPVQAAGQASDTTGAAMNYLPGKKAITIVR